MIRFLLVTAFMISSQVVSAASIQTDQHTYIGVKTGSNPQLFQLKVCLVDYVKLTPVYTDQCASKLIGGREFTQEQLLQTGKRISSQARDEEANPKYLGGLLTAGYCLAGGGLGSIVPVLGNGMGCLVGALIGTGSTAWYQHSIATVNRAALAGGIGNAVTVFNGSTENAVVVLEKYLPKN